MKQWLWPLFADLNSGNVPGHEDPAGFGYQRKHHIHEGVDLHCKPGMDVYPVEPGMVVWVGQFTGPALGHHWWLDTEAVMVEGASGIVVYGEIVPWFGIRQGATVGYGSLIGRVTHVLPATKSPRPSMLHLELRQPGHIELFDWKLGTEKPDWLLDPTNKLKGAE